MDRRIHTEADLDLALAALLELDPRLRHAVSVAGRPPLRRRSDGFAGLASIVVSMIISFPMCYLFELDGRAIWSVALMHLVVQGVHKLVVVPDAIYTTSALAWALVVLVAPLIVFAFRRGDQT